MKTNAFAGVFCGVLLVFGFALIYVKPSPDWTINTTGRDIPYSVTPKQCVDGLVPNQALMVCQQYLQANPAKVN